MSGKVEGSRAEALGSLSKCLVEGDVEQLARAKRGRRRSLTLSLLFQAAALAALLFVPLFGKGERIALAKWVPQPIYASGGGPLREQRSARPIRNQPLIHHDIRIFQPPHIPTGVRQPHDETTVPGDAIPGVPPGTGNGSENIIGAIPVGPDNGPANPPAPIAPKPSEKKRIVMTHLEPAMLLHRVEPVYPPLMHQIHRAGRVELRAVISTDGTIQLLQIVGGDPGFYPSAIEAVRQWRYRPTILNGQPVEVETYITVIYQLQ